MPPTWKTIAATWLSPGHPGPLCFHMGCRQHSLLAIKIAEDKRQTASTSWQILICKQAFLICSRCFFSLKTRAFMSEKFNKRQYFWGGAGVVLLVRKFFNHYLTLLRWRLDTSEPTIVPKWVDMHLANLVKVIQILQFFEPLNSILWFVCVPEVWSLNLYSFHLHKLVTFRVLSDSLVKKLRHPDWPSIKMPL